MTTQPLLEISKLSVAFKSRQGSRTTVLDDVSFSMGHEVVGVVGESGSGKSTLARTVLDILPRHASVRCSRLAFDGVDLPALSQQARAALLGRRMTMVLQDPRYSLNPVIGVGEQVAESLVHVKGLRRSEARERTLAALAAVKLRDPAAVYRRYPHEISGGMGQRVMIAMMTVLGPELLFADEPTSALDEGTKRVVLETLRDLAAERSFGLVLISHDLDLVSSFCDRIVVMKEGRIVEDCRAADLPRSRNAFTKKLLAARLTVTSEARP
jgi:peptide/nickel transport system ATP-binding protein